MGFDPETGGRTRLALTDADKKGRDLPVGGCTESLDVKIDEIGSIFGVREGTDSSELPLMVGSHIDTVRDAGCRRCLWSPRRLGSDKDTE